MAPDDPGGIRELRFRHEDGDVVTHVIVQVNPDGTGSVSVASNLLDIEAGREETKIATKASLRVLSIARHLVFEAFCQAGGTLDELRDK